MSLWLRIAFARIRARSIMFLLSRQWESWGKRNGVLVSCADLQYFELPYFLRDIVAGVESFGCSTQD